MWRHMCQQGSTEVVIKATIVLCISGLDSYSWHTRDSSPRQYLLEVDNSFTCLAAPEPAHQRRNTNADQSALDVCQMREDLLLASRNAPPLGYIAHILRLRRRLLVTITIRSRRAGLIPPSRSLTETRRNTGLARTGTVRRGRGSRSALLDLRGAHVTKQLLHLDKHGPGIVDDPVLVHLIAEHRGAVLLVFGIHLGLGSHKGGTRTAVRVGVVHDGVGQHVGELAVELRAVDDALGWHELFADREQDTACARVPARKGCCRRGCCPVAMVDGIADGPKVLWHKNPIPVPRSVALAYLVRKEVRIAVADDLLHGRVADLVEGPRPCYVRRRSWRNTVLCWSK